jgi:hypothetical protein
MCSLTLASPPCVFIPSMAGPQSAPDPELGALALGLNIIP